MKALAWVYIECVRRKLAGKSCNQAFQLWRARWQPISPGSSSASAAPRARPPKLQAGRILAPCLMALPNFLFALYLLRRIPQNAVTQEQ